MHSCLRRNVPRRHRRLLVESLEHARCSRLGCWIHPLGLGGLVTTDFGYVRPTIDSGNDVAAIQSDGKIVVVGESRQEVFGSLRSRFALTRFNGDGSLDFDLRCRREGHGHLGRLRVVGQ